VLAVTDLKKNQIAGFHFEKHSVFGARTGNTGEDGFEILGAHALILLLWANLLAVGQPFGLKPAGLGARDTLRTEVCYPLFGHELNEGITPTEAGLGAFVALDKGEFPGRTILAQQKTDGVKRRLAAFKMTDKSAPPRPHYPIWANGVKVGEVVSGTQSPSLNVGIGMGYVSPELAKPDTRIEIEIRGNRFSAVVVPKPIYRK
jgi:aminomethyltransferase